MKHLKTFNEQIINDSKIDKDELYKFIEQYWNKHNVDGVIAPLNFDILHNYRIFKFIELYKFEEENSPIGDSYALYFIEPYKGTTVNWILSTIDVYTLNDIVNKMKFNI